MLVIKYIRWLGWIFIGLGLIGSSGRIRITGEGVMRDRELFWGLLDHLPATSFVDVSILIAGSIIGTYLLGYSHAMQKLLSKPSRAWWLYLSMALVVLLLFFPILAYQGWEELAARPNYVKRWLPSLDNLTGSDFNLVFEVGFSMLAIYVYSLIGSIILSGFILIRAYKSDRIELNGGEVEIEDHLLP